MKRLEASVAAIAKELEAREKLQDRMLVLNREMVRSCATAIKEIHAGNADNAEEILKQVGAKIKTISDADGFTGISSPIYQEYCEAAVLLALIKRKSVPGHEELRIPFVPYLNGLLDCVGELRREMLEALRRGDHAQAGYFFDAMSGIYELLLPLKYSRSILPEFRRKQDVARIQVENARSELLLARR